MGTSVRGLALGFLVLSLLVLPLQGIWAETVLSGEDCHCGIPNSVGSLPLSAAGPAHDQSCCNGDAGCGGTCTGCTHGLSHCVYLPPADPSVSASAEWSKANLFVPAR